MTGTIAAAGNEGPGGYIVGSPSTVSGSLSVAAIDGGFATFPGATFALSTGKSFNAVNANGATFANGTTYNVKVIRNADGSVSLGCAQADFGTLAPNTLAVVARGVCARVHKAIVGQKAGAAAVAQINNAAGLPPVARLRPGGGTQLEWVYQREEAAAVTPEQRFRSLKVLLDERDLVSNLEIIDRVFPTWRR